MNENAPYAEEYEARYASLRDYPREAGFVDRLFRERDLFPGPLLDLACGLGGHAVELARRGWRVVGLDFNPAMLARMQTRAARAGCAVESMAADMTDFRADRPFRAAINFFYSFQDALPDAAARRAFLRCVHRALAPGARFVLDYLPEENNLRLYPEGVELPVAHVENPDGTVTVTVSRNRILNEDEKELVFIRRVLRGERVIEESCRQGRLRRLFLEPTRESFRAAGFAVEAEYGDFDDAVPFDETCRRVIAVLRREEGPA